MMSSNSPDSHKISLKIIEAIKQHPVLYISEIKGNPVKLQEFRQKVWKRISDELGLDPGWVKLKWKNLRDTYCRILKYKNKSPQGLRRKKWIFEDHLSFLKFPYEPNYQTQYVELTEEYINDINTEVISSQELLEQLEDNEDDDDYTEYLEIPEENIALNKHHEEMSSENNIKMNNLPKISNDNTSQLSIDAYAKQIQSKFRKIRPKKAKMKESVLSKPVIVQNTENKKIIELPSQKNVYYKNSVDGFFYNMAHIVKKLPLKAQADIKMDICKIISETETQYFKQSTPQNIQKYTNMPGMIPKMVLIPCRLIDNENNCNKN